MASQDHHHHHHHHHHHPHLFGLVIFGIGLDNNIYETTWALKHAMS